MRRHRSKFELGLAVLVLVVLAAPVTAAYREKSNSRAIEKKPNVLFILLDDVGYGQLSSFGGPYRTPNIDKVAARGLRYANFHTTALCSPTRAALLLGRNHHSVNMATITETASNQPGYTGILPKNAGSLADYLRSAGYDTYALGKWHLTPIAETSPSGPFDRWPTMMGFDHWYGFQGAESDQFRPGLWSDTKPIETPNRPNYHLTEDLADRAVQFVSEHATSTKPFFLYFATGAGHDPHQVPKAWIERNKGRFDQGWDKARVEILARQKKMGIMPANTALSARPESIKAWDEVQPMAKPVFARMQEVHAGFIEHTDHEIGRILEALEKSGQLENTIVIVTSDNGASGEGTPIGTTNIFKMGNAIKETPEEIIKNIDKLGGAESWGHYPAGWALAGNTPFRYWKQSNHEGGVHDPLIISWPARIKDVGRIRYQFVHAIDILPTLLEAAAVKAPEKVRDLVQMPIEGVSAAATLTDSKAPTKKVVQYFEMLGNRGLWKDGWKVSVFHGRWPWQSEPLDLRPFDQDVWELYNTRNDPSESKNLAAKYPEKVAELQALWYREAKAHNVLPLDGHSLGERVKEANQMHSRGRAEFVYEGPTVRIPDALAPSVMNRSFFVVAEVEIPAGGAEGVLMADGGSFAGYSIYVKEGRLVYEHNYARVAFYKVTSTEAVPSGRVTLRIDFKNTGTNKGNVTLTVNGRKAGEGEIPQTIPYLYSLSETFDVGSDTITPVSEAYASPFAFTGRLRKLTVSLGDGGAVKSAPDYVAD